MSINYCTLSSSTIDAFCGNQRAKVLARLIDIAHPPVVNPPSPPPNHDGSGDVGQPNYGYTNPWYDPYSIDTDNTVSFDQPYITVTVDNLFGDKGSETLAANAQLDFVTVTNVEFESTADASISGEITVNISGLEI